VSDGGIIVQGNSVGSQVAMHMAAEQPRRVLAMIISGTGYPPPREPTARWKQRYEKEGIAPRREQIIDHFAPAAQKQPHLQYYADMLLELNNASTAPSIVATNQALMNAPGEDFYVSLSVPT